MDLKYRILSAEEPKDGVSNALNDPAICSRDEWLYHCGFVDGRRVAADLANRFELDNIDLMHAIQEWARGGVSFHREPTADLPNYEFMEPWQIESECASRLIKTIRSIQKWRAGKATPTPTNIQKNKSNEKPPLGVRPRWAADEARFSELSEAIKRYWDANRPIPVEWIEEWNDLAPRVKDYMDKNGDAATDHG